MVFCFNYVTEEPSGSRTDVCSAVVFDSSVPGVGGGSVQDDPGEQTPEESSGVGQPRVPGAEGHLPAAGHVQAPSLHHHVPLLQWD